MRARAEHEAYWQIIWRQFKQHKIGVLALFVAALFCVVGIYAPFLAASKPLIVEYQGEWYFPLFRYLFYRGYYTKRIDLFFNLLIFTTLLLPICLLLFRRSRYRLAIACSAFCAAQGVFFLLFAYGSTHNPAFDAALNQAKEKALKSHPLPNWEFDLHYMSPYAKLNLLIHEQILQRQHHILLKYSKQFLQNQAERGSEFQGIPSLWQTERNNEAREMLEQQQLMQNVPKDSDTYAFAQAFIQYILDRRRWIEANLNLLHHEWMPLLRPYHWEDDAGGDSRLNRFLPFWEVTRINNKDLMAALIFGVRISLVVGFLAVTLSLAIGLPVGAFAGYYGGKLDLIVCRMIEVWEAMPTFFMLLMAVAILQSKSIFMVILIIGVFSWTSFSRYIRGEFFKQRNLSYVEACRALGLNDGRIMFSQIMPNALPPVLTLLPFAIMAAISTEAGLSFLGLGEEGSCSWGILMAEGRSAFPAQSYLLWPPAILLTILLVAIALAGDALRDAMDPKMEI